MQVTSTNWLEIQNLFFFHSWYSNFDKSPLRPKRHSIFVQIKGDREREKSDEHFIRVLCPLAEFNQQKVLRRKCFSIISYLTISAEIVSICENENVITISLV